jgi:hypothetical protein
VLAVLDAADAVAERDERNNVVASRAIGRR